MIHQLLNCVACEFADMLRAPVAWIAVMYECMLPQCISGIKQLFADPTRVELHGELMLLRHAISAVLIQLELAKNPSLCGYKLRHISEYMQLGTGMLVSRYFCCWR